MRRTLFRGTLFATASCIAVSCDGTHASNRVAVSTFSVESIAGFGAPPTQVQVAQPARGGAVLAAPTAVAEGPDRAVYVLDMDYKKVAVFNRDGSLRLTFGGYGTGAGEFLLPTALDQVDSSLLVYDFQQARISVFDLRGQYERTIEVRARARSAVRLGPTIWLSQIASTDYMIFAVDVASGERRAVDVPVTAEDLRFSPQGVAASLGRAPDGDLLIANPRASVWYVLHDGHVIEHGQNAVARDRAVVQGRRAISPSQALGIGALADHRVGVLYATVAFADAGITRHAAFDVFEASGRYLGTAKMSLPTKNAFAVSRDGQSFYVAFSLPYPHITQYRLIEHPLGDR
jgi:hypothetical protein